MAKYTLFLGTYSKGEGKGLFSGEFDSDTGKLNFLGSIDIENPSYMVLAQDMKTLYGVSEVGSFKDEKGGALFSLSVENPANMQMIDMQGTHGRSPCHLCIQDRFVFTANYTEGSLTIFETKKDGNIIPSYQSIYHFGKGANPGRQEKSHVHFTSVTPDGKYLAVCDLGIDAVLFYPYSSDSGLSSNAKKIQCPSGAGPRHLVFSQDGKYLYVLTELQNTVLVYKYNDGNTELLQEISTLPVGFTGKTTAAAIHISPCGGFLAASNRGHDSLAIFKIQDDGTLCCVNHLMTGKEPRDFRYSPDGKWILSANQNDSSVTVYRIENNTFTETGNISVPQPVCITFGGANA